MTPKLSLLMTAIRRERWAGVCDSIAASFSQEWELIICGPHEPEESLMKRGNVKYICDFGSPSRCQQRAFLAAEGEFVARMDDDGLWLPGAIDRAFALNPDRGRGVGIIFTEGDNYNPAMVQEEHFHKRAHKMFDGLPIPDHYIVTSASVFASRQDALAIGGFDCIFETSAISTLDYGIRLQNYGVQIVMLPGVSIHHTHMPGTSGDHAPMHHAQLDHDEPLFRSIYSHPDFIHRKAVDPENWRKSADRWIRRFGA